MSVLWQASQWTGGEAHKPHKPHIQEGRTSTWWIIPAMPDVWFPSHILLSKCLRTTTF